MPTPLDNLRRDLEALKDKFSGADIPVAIASTIQRLEAIIRKLERDHHEQKGSQ